MSIYAVNGKEPVAAWIESLDPEVITSSKATDIVGTNHGTLTDMDLTADPDTARRPDTDAGGVRALVFDGSNDNVNLGSHAWVNSAASISLWVKLAAVSGNQFFFDGSSNADDGAGMSIRAMSDGRVRYWHNIASSGLLDSTTALSTGVWNHIVGSFDGTISRLFVNGIQEATRTGDSVNAVSNTYLLGRSPMFGGTLNGRIDDVRLFFGTHLILEDAVYLSQSRGIVASTGKTRSRINGGLINSGLCRSRT